MNNEQPRLLGPDAQYDAHSQNLNENFTGKLDSDPVSSYSLNLVNQIQASSNSIKQVKQDNFVAKSGRNQFQTAANYRTMEPSQQKNLRHYKNLTYLNRQSGSNLHNPQRQNLMISKSKVYKSHKNLNTRQHLAKKKMGANNQILAGVQSERYLVEKYDSGLQPMVFSKKGRIGVIGINPAAINSVNPSSRGVASRNQDGKPFGAFLQAHQSKKLLKQDP